MDGLQWKTLLKWMIWGGFHTPIFGLTAIVYTCLFSPPKLVTDVQEVGPVKPAQDRLGAQKTKKVKLHIFRQQGDFSKISIYVKKKTKQK